MVLFLLLVCLSTIRSSCGSPFSFQSSAKVPPRTNDELNWFDIGIWNKNGSDVNDQPTVGDSIIADGSNGGCDGFVTMNVPVNHFSIYINNVTDRYERVEFLSLFNDTNFLNCRTVVIIGPDGTLNANSIFIGRGVILFVKGQIIANSIFQEKDSLIQGDGYIFSNSTILEGDIMAGKIYFGLCSPRRNCPNCAPKMQVGNGNNVFSWSSSIGNDLRIGGSAIVRGTIYGFFEFGTTVSFNSVKLENALVFVITRDISNTTNVSNSYVPVLFESIVPPTNVSFTRWAKDRCFPFPAAKLPCTFEARWWLQCTSQSTSYSLGICFQVLSQTCGLTQCPTVEPCAFGEGTLCASKASNGLSVLLFGKAPTSACATSLSFSGQGTADESNSTTILIVAIVVPVSVVLAGLVAVFVYFCRKRELEKKEAKMRAKINSKISHGSSNFAGAVEL